MMRVLTPCRAIENTCRDIAHDKNDAVCTLWYVDAIVMPGAKYTIRNLSAAVNILLRMKSVQCTFTIQDQPDGMLPTTYVQVTGQDVAREGTTAETQIELLKILTRGEVDVVYDPRVGAIPPRSGGDDSTSHMVEPGEIDLVYLPPNTVVVRKIGKDTYADLDTPHIVSVDVEMRSSRGPGDFPFAIAFLAANMTGQVDAALLLCIDTLEGGVDPMSKDAFVDEGTWQFWQRNWGVYTALMRYAVVPKTTAAKLVQDFFAMFKTAYFMSDVAADFAQVRRLAKYLPAGEHLYQRHWDSTVLSSIISGIGLVSPAMAAACKDVRGIINACPHHPVFDALANLQHWMHVLRVTNSTEKPDTLKW